MYDVGFGRADITVFEPNITMLGWGQPHNVVRGVSRPLAARSMFMRSGDETLAYVCCDLLFVSEAVRGEVLDRLALEDSELGLDDANVILSATHTHSGPSGFSSYFWKSLAAPGFSRVVYDGIVSGILTAIREAARAARPARLRFAQRTLPADDGLCFNRAWRAYNRNVDVHRVDEESRSYATDRVMSLLRVDEVATGAPIGVLNWFPLHGTCVHSDNQMMHPDHKGLAADLLEGSGEGAPPFAIFAQEAAGDVTPNHRWSSERGLMVGRYDDDLESVEWVAEREASYARALYDSALVDGIELEGPLEACVHYVDFRDYAVDASVVPSAAGRRTRPPRVGVSMARGTKEGPGPLGDAPWLSDALNRLVGLMDPLDPQYPLLDLDRGTRGRLLGLLPLRRSMLPPVDPLLVYSRQLLADNALASPAFIAHRLPVQLVRIGPLAIAATTFEATTVSGRRLRESLRWRLGPLGIDHILVNTYCNAYSGYLTTFEEYQFQRYEGAYTLFGPWSLSALRSAYAAVAEGLGKVRIGGSRPQPIPREELDRRPFRQPWSAF